MMANSPSTVRVMRMLKSATTAIRISSPTAMPKILIPIVMCMTGSGRRKVRPIASAQPARSNIYYNIILSGFSSAMERFASAAARADERSCACLFYADPMVGPDDVVRDRVLHPSAVAHAEAEGPATGCAPKDEKPDPSRFQRPSHRGVRETENPGHLLGTQGHHQPSRGA